MNPDRATALLAVVRIICVLGMSFAIALGIFALLGGWWLTGLASLVASVPFFAVMRFMEKHSNAPGVRDIEATSDAEPES